MKFSKLNPVNFTDRQLSLINKLKSKGCGWAAFADSVYNSGSGTPRQEIALEALNTRLHFMKNKRGANGYKHNFTDYEIMSFGLHI